MCCTPVFNIPQFATCGHKQGSDFGVSLSQINRNRASPLTRCPGDKSSILNEANRCWCSAGISLACVSVIATRRCSVSAAVTRRCRMHHDCAAYWGMTIMSLCSFYAVLLLALALSTVSASACADIYRWVDAFGHVTYSDTPPPKGTRLVGVVPYTPPPPPTAAAIGEAEIRRLSQRILSLEREVQLANRPPLPSPVQYIPPPQSAPCDPRWVDCDPWWSPPLFVSAPVSRHFGAHPAFHHGGGFRPR